MAPSLILGTYESEIDAANDYDVSVIEHAIKEPIAITDAGTLYA